MSLSNANPRRLSWGTAGHRSPYEAPLIFLPSVGRSATHALVLAQLTCAGARQGMHAFIVPIRSLQDHTPLPGEPTLLPQGPLPEGPAKLPCPRGPRDLWEKLGLLSQVQEGLCGTVLVLTGQVTLSKSPHLSDLSSLTCHTGAVTPVSQAAVSWNGYVVPGTANVSLK